MATLRRLAGLGACLCLITSAPGAAAAILGGAILQQTGSGEFVQLDPAAGFAVGADTFDDDNLYAFDEAQVFALPHAITVEIGPTDGLLPAGTVVSSHYVFFDSVQGSHFGFVEFDTPILGIALSRDSMGATDALANTPVRYLSPELRGLETGDEVWIDEENPARLYLLWAGSSPGDYIRVFTDASGTPAMM